MLWKAFAFFFIFSLLFTSFAVGDVSGTSHDDLTVFEQLPEPFNGIGSVLNGLIKGPGEFLNDRHC